ncbi:MAG: DUF885 family protein [Fimbriimonadaceae bacterium]
MLIPILGVAAVAASPSMTQSTPTLPDVIRVYQADRDALRRLHPIAISPTRTERMARLYRETLAKLDSLTTADRADQVDALLLRNHLNFQLAQQEIVTAELASYAYLIPFAPTIVGLEETRRRMEPVDPEAAAATLNELANQVRAQRNRIGRDLTADKFTANRAASASRSLRNTLREWNGFYSGYDPLYTWWCAEPYKAADEELRLYADTLREKLVGVKPDDTDAIVGAPIGRDALLAALRFEMIPYTPEELIAIGEREYAWCEREMIRASRELGFGDDWRAALEHVKGLHVAPGEQPNLVRNLALEAIEFLEARDLVTIPPLAKETWRMSMMSPEQQRVSPFFLGGEQIIVSFPTNTMTHDEKMMSMRGNNRHFSRATVQHELIPGHHLQQFMNARNRPYRSLFSTPFWTEGWALYWEMLLWDLGFPVTPEDRIGMLFWRMHRCARIVFSLKFHLGEMTPEECIDYLVQKVGHERNNAEGEVRRSFAGNYGPLYQLAYMIGGLQFRAMHAELVGSGKMTNREFHDAILRENNIPVAVLRAIMTGAPIPREPDRSWRFADPLP